MTAPAPVAPTTRTDLATAAVALLRAHPDWSARHAVRSAVKDCREWALYWKALSDDGRTGLCNLVARLERGDK